MRTMLVMAVMVTPAFADAPKYTRKPPVAVDAHISDRTKPIAPAKQSEPAKPTATAEVVFKAMIDQEPIRREQEDLLVGLVRDTPDDADDKPDLMFRLAEHYAKQHLLWHMRSLEPEMPKPKRDTP